jgi:hypothetical protein
MPAVLSWMYAYEDAHLGTTNLRSLTDLHQPFEVQIHNYQSGQQDVRQIGDEKGVVLTCGRRRLVGDS